MQTKPNRFAALGLLSLGAFVACSADDGAAGKPSLVRITAQFASDTCQDGGHQIESGADSNGNAQLDDDEVTSSSLVCDGAVGRAGLAGAGTKGANGASGALTAVVVTDEPAGDACANGGQRVDLGLDANADGEIDEDAHVDTTYVCNGNAGAAGNDGAEAVVKVTAEAAGANCANGGKRLDYGLDSNADGVLQAAEIGSTRYSCDSAPGVSGSAPLFTSMNEPAGASCPDGGQRIDHGQDTNRNGTLDIAEITATSYTCNGEDGADGADGTPGTDVHSTLVAVAAEPDGAHCVAGGAKLTYGVDDDGDGTLDAGEIDNTRYVCNGVDGDDDSLLELVTVASEAPGVNCPGGGHVVKVGLDDDGDKALEVGEVDSTSYVCDFDELQNPSFELPGYQGWKLQSTSGQWLLAASGTTLHYGDTVFDWVDGANEQLTSPGLPYTVTATDGTKVAVQTQTVPGPHRISQDFMVPKTAASLSWDMYYKNTAGVFDPDEQYIAVNIRRPIDDSILATLYKTTEGVDAEVLTMMTPFSVNLAPYAGQYIRFDIETNLQYAWIDVALDNFAIH